MTVAKHTIGLQRRVFTQPTAAIRNADGGVDLRATIWYPARGRAETILMDVGPVDNPYMLVGRAELGAPFAEDRRHPVILYSHGFNGSAATTSWFGSALAGAGYVAIAVDHPGNNIDDDQTAGGALLWWLRADDFKVALEGVAGDPILGPRIDADRVGVSGYSMGGLTALLALGGIFDGLLYDDFCLTHPGCPIAPPAEALPMFNKEKPHYPDFMRAEFALMAKDRRLPAAKAGFIIAPTVIGLRPESLRAIDVPVTLIVGSDDSITTPEIGAALAASLIPGADLVIVPGANHDSFINPCSQAGVDANFCGCGRATEQESAHQVAFASALALFDAAFRNEDAPSPIR